MPRKKEQINDSEYGIIQLTAGDLHIELAVTYPMAHRTPC